MPRFQPGGFGRSAGWKEVPLMCATEVDVPGALQKCIRLLILANTDGMPSGIRHVYLREARQLRPDLVE